MYFGQVVNFHLFQRNTFDFGSSRLGMYLIHSFNTLSLPLSPHCKIALTKAIESIKGKKVSEKDCMVF